MLVTTALVSLGTVGIAPCSSETPSENTAGVYQLIEARQGRDRCVGVVIQLSKLRFPATIKPEQIKITEAKHGRDITSLMMWDVDPARRRLTIRFKAGKGGFGTGNRMGVQIDQAILEGTSDTGHALWVIGSDPL